MDDKRYQELRKKLAVVCRENNTTLTDFLLMYAIDTLNININTTVTDIRPEQLTH